MPSTFSRRLQVDTGEASDRSAVGVSNQTWYCSPSCQRRRIYLSCEALGKTAAVGGESALGNRAQCSAVVLGWIVDCCVWQ
jgi:hypothetical protein